MNLESLYVCLRNARRRQSHAMRHGLWKQSAEANSEALKLEEKIGAINEAKSVLTPDVKQKGN